MCVWDDFELNWCLVLCAWQDLCCTLHHSSECAPVRAMLLVVWCGAAEGVALGEESSAAIQLLARQQEELRGVQQELRGERQRNAQLENDNVQLQARVSGGWGTGREGGPGVPVVGLQRLAAQQ